MNQMYNYPLSPSTTGFEIIYIEQFELHLIQAVTLPEYKENTAILFDYSSNPWS